MRLSSTTNDELLPVAKLEWSVRLPNATFATTAEIKYKGPEDRKAIQYFPIIYYMVDFCIV